MSGPIWLPTARKLAAVWTGPGLAQHLLSRGVPVYHCSYCGASDLAPDDNCCSADPSVGGFTEQTYPSPVTVIDLSSNRAGLANVGALLEALPSGWLVRKSARGGYLATNGGQRCRAATAAHALAAALVAVSP